MITDGHGLSFGGNENVLKSIMVIHNSVDTLKATELHTLNGQSVWSELYLHKAKPLQNPPHLISWLPLQRPSVLKVKTQILRPRFTHILWLFPRRSGNSAISRCPVSCHASEPVDILVFFLTCSTLTLTHSLWSSSPDSLLSPFF